MTEPAFSLSHRAGGVAVLTLAVPDSELNLVRPHHATELLGLLDALGHRRDVRALVIASGSPRAFCAGADLGELTRTRAVQDGIDMARDVQRVLDRIAELDIPVVAAVHGPCLGVGASLALVADARVATHDRRTRLGFPELRLGVVPVGAAARLTELIGLGPALELLFGARLLTARDAQRRGLVTEVVAPGIALNVAVDLALDLARERRRRPRLRAAVRNQVAALTRRLEHNRLHRAVVLREIRQRVTRHAFGNHAAPERLLRVVRTGLERGRDSWLEAERRTFGELLISPEATHLMHLYLETHAVRRAAASSDVGARIEGVGVVGSGPLAVALVTEAARAGLAVRLGDQSSGALADGLRAVRDRLDAQVTAGTLDLLGRERVLGRLTVTVGRDGFAGVPFVLATARERPEAWQLAVSELETHVHPEAVIACSTTSTRLEAITASADRPQQIVGWIQREPVERTPLLELAVTARTAPRTIATALAVAHRTGHTPIVVSDSPCFFTPRLLGAWHGEALRLVTEGVPARVVDATLLDWGFERGPFASMTDRGHHASLRVLQALAAAFGDRHGLPRDAERALERGDFSTGRSRTDATLRREIVERCVMRMVNEAILCFGEGVIESARDANVAAVYGAGFPAFRGGPLRQADEVGIVETTRRLERLRRAHGRRFAPADLLVQMTRSGGTFHGDARVQPRSERPRSPGAATANQEPAP